MTSSTTGRFRQKERTRRAIGDAARVAERVNRLEVGEVRGDQAGGVEVGTGDRAAAVRAGTRHDVPERADGAAELTGIAAACRSYAAPIDTARRRGPDGR